MQKPNRLALFPDTVTIENNALSIGGQELAALARKFGTPLYIYDRETMDALVARYKAALKAHYPGQSIVTYAGKAFLCATIADWAHKQGLWVDCTGEVEISTAVAGGVPAASLLVHGVNKSSADLSFAAHHAGTIVVDNLSELDHLSSALKATSRTRRSAWTVDSVWLRLQPGIPVRTAPCVH